MNPDPAPLSVLIYWIVAGLISTIIFENTKFRNQTDFSGNQMKSIVTRRFFYFVTGGFSLPFLLLALTLVGPVAFATNKKFKS